MRRFLHLTKVPRSPWIKAKRVLTDVDFIEDMKAMSCNIYDIIKDKKHLMNDNSFLNTTNLQQNTYEHGLIILLLGRIGMNNNDFFSKDIAFKQKILAETTEHLRNAYFFHRKISKKPESSQISKDFHLRNKLYILLGDFLVSTAFVQLALIENSYISENIFQSVTGMSGVEMIHMSDKNFNLLPAEPDITKSDNVICNTNKRLPLPYKVDDILGNARDEWFLRSLMTEGHLMGAACSGALMLSECDENLIENGHLFGQNVALALHAKLQYNLFVKKQFNYATLVSAPVLLHLYKHPLFYGQLMEIVNSKDDKYVFDKVWEIVCSGNGLCDTLDLQTELQRRALNTLTKFNDCEEKNILIDIIKEI